MEVVLKAGGVAKDVNVDTFVADRPSIIHLKIAPEKVARFERQGADLVLVLKEGGTTTVRGFFTTYDHEERSDLVLQDEAGVWWWGQYTAPWSEFHFTEIEWDDGAPVALWGDSLPGWLIAGLAVLGVGAAVGGGGGGGNGGVLLPVLPPAPQPPAPPPPAPEPPAPQPPAPEPPAPQPPAPEPPAPQPPAPEPPAPPPPAPEPPAPQPPVPGPPEPQNQPPTVPDYAHTIEEDGRVTGQVVGSDPDGDALTYRQASDPKHGTVTVHPDGSYTYTPDPDYHGPDEFTVIVDDGKGGTTTSTVVITVTPVNDPPQAPGYSHVTPEDTPISGKVVGSDVDGDTLTYTPGTAPEHGTVTVNPDGSYTYTPDPDYHGPDSFTVIVSDGHGGTTTSTVNITVTPVNDPPVAPDYAHTLDEDTSVTGKVVGSDPDGDTLRYALEGPPQNGTVVVNPDGSYTYTPNPNYHGPDSFTVTVSDGKGGTTTSTVDIVVKPVNDPVTANDDSFTVAEDHALVLNLLGNDSAPDGGLAITRINGTPLTPGTAQSIPVTDDGTPGGTVIGSVEVDAAGTLTFVPAPNYDGPVSFPYEVRDADGDTDTATVTITVTPDAPPVITPVDGNGDGSGADPLIEQGQVTVHEAGLAGGSSAGDGSATATGTITVQAGDGVRSVTLGGTVITLAELENAGNTPIVISTVHGHLTVTGYTPNGTHFNGVSTGGTIHYEYTLTTPVGNDAAHPDNLIEDISVEVEDEGGNTVIGSPVQINIIDDAPAATDDAVTTAGGSAQGNVIAGTITTGTGTGGADTEGADGGLTVSHISHPNGNVSDMDALGITLQGAYGQLAIYGDGSYTYTRADGGPGGVDEVFTYTVTDADGDTTTATLTISLPDATPTVNGDNPAVPGEAHNAVNEGGRPDGNSTPGSDTTSGSFTFTSVDGVGSLTVGGVDVSGLVSGDPSTAIPPITTPEGHTLTITGYEYNASTGTGTVWYSYALTGEDTHPDGNAHNTIIDIIPIVVTDADGDVSPTGHLNISIVDDVPVPVADNGNVIEGQTLTVDAAHGVLSNDAPGADGWTAGGGVVGAVKGGAGTATENLSNGAVTVAGDYGTLTLNADGSYTYVSTADAITANAQDVFTYTVKDADGDLVTTTLTIAVSDVTGTGLNLTGSVSEAGLPTGSTPSATSETVTGELTGLPTGWTPTTLSGSTTHGTWTIFDDGGTWKYSFTLTTPTTDVAGVDETNRFTFTTADGDGNTASNTVTISIVDDVPVVSAISAQPASVDELIVHDGGVRTATVDVSGAFSADYVFGADGAAATDSVVWDYTLVVNDPASGLTSGGQPVTLALEGGQVVGRVGGAAGPVAFTLSVDDSGQLTLVQSLPIDHASVTDASETLALGLDKISVRGTVTVTDGDGDPATRAIDLDLGGKLVFTDDGPSIDAVSHATVSEAKLPFGSDPTPAELTVSGTLTVNYHGDGEGPQSDLRFDATQAALDALDLTSGGTPVTWSPSADGKTLTATANGQPVFTVAINAAGTGYTFVLSGPLDHGALDQLDLPFAFTATDGDGDTASSSFTVTVLDDSQAGVTERDIEVAEDSTVTFNTTADANVSVPAAGDPEAPQHGSVSVDPATGQITYVPHADYSGEDSFTYTITNDDGSSTTTTVTVTVNPVADAPTLGTDKTLLVDEDHTVGLGLALPAITDATDQNGGAAGTGDNPERIGAITLTPSGEGAAGAGFSTTADGVAGGTPITLTPVGGVLTIVITDTSGGTTPSSLHATDVPAAGTPGVYYLTQAEYEAIAARPQAESHQNFDVAVSATSYEVDDSGAPLAGVPGATSNQAIHVDVQAVTDPVTLDTVTGGSTVVIVSEDGTVDFSASLVVTLGDLDGNGQADMDGSQSHWVTVTGLPVGSVVNGTTITSTAQVVRVDAPDLTTGGSLPAIHFQPPHNFSGDLSGITVTLHVQDMDSDGPTNGVELTSSVTLGVQVNPVAGDVDIASPAAAPEDSNIAFLAGIRHTDTDGAGTGSERITEVSFTVPAGWTFVDPGTAGVTVATSGGVTTISFAAGMSQGDIEAALDAFTVRPPAHSSADATLDVTVKSVDSNTVGGTLVEAAGQVTRPVTITVTPVAEQVGGDSDGDGHGDVTLTPGHDYSGTPGAEDSWYTLGTHNGFKLEDGWSNEDDASQGGREETYAELTPVLTSTPETGDTVIGSIFRYTDGGGAVHELTYTGPGSVRVPVEFLDTLEFRPAANVSGTFDIQVQAYTVDYDDDGGSTPVTATSGSALLENIVIAPVADGVTLALNGRASGLEDSDIPLAIKTTSIDPSETFNVTISGIPDGAVITYGGTPLTVTGGSVTITGFDNSVPMTIRPPLNSNVDFSLNVSAVSVDGASVSTPTPSVTLHVGVAGVADVPAVQLAAPQTFTEAALDDPLHPGVGLNALVTGVTTPDTDGSEVVSVRISGLGEGFSLTGATLLQTGATPEDRVWTVSATQLANVKIHVPDNFSGTARFKVAGVTTENDGDSRTGAPVEVNFTVTPSPEATATVSAVLVEDEISLLKIAVAPQNGDNDESLGRVFIAVDDASTAQYTLYLGTAALSAAGLATQVLGGVNYYVVPADQVGQLGAMGGAHLDEDLGGFRYQYEVIDSAYGAVPAGSSVAVIKDGGTFALSATPVTDPVDLGISGITGGSPGTTPEAVAVDTAGTLVTVNLNIASVDHDGSEQVVRVLIDDVPNGVTVVAPVGGGYEVHQLGGGSWMLVFKPGALEIDAAGGVTLPVSFVAGADTPTGSHGITVTVQTQDRGEKSSGQAQDSVTWTLESTIAGAGSNPAPTIDQWEYNDAGVTEDQPFSLADVIDAAVTVEDSSVPNIFTVRLTALPEGTEVDGMAMTVINGVPTWSATVVVPAGASDAAVETALENLLAGIQITPPPNSNENNAAGDFHFNATLTGSAQGGQSASATIPASELVIPVEPVTDAAVITVTAVDEGEDPVGGSVSVTIDVSNAADGTHGQIVDGRLYVQVDGGSANAGGTLSQGGTAITPTAVSGVPGVPAGNYYVINVGTAGSSVTLEYTPPSGTSPGDVSFQAWAQTREANASGSQTATASDTATISRVNNGVTVNVSSDPVTGHEPADSSPSSAIELPALAVTLTDGSGNEAIESVLLSGVPVGFLVFVDGQLASNAGGDGRTNTWVLAEGGAALGTVSILPPAHWSGTLDDLKLVVESGETALADKLFQSFDLAPVTVLPVANGVELATTQAIGREGQIVDLNMNAAMKDPVAATSTLPDESTETMTVQFTGLGEHAAFYVGSTLLDDATSIAYDGATDTYTITGLVQEELDQLGVKQAASALTDQDGATAGVQIAVTAWTVDGGDVSAPDSTLIDLHLIPVAPTSGADSFLWGGAGKPVIDGRAGTDTVALRMGEDVSGSELGLGLRNIEVLDLSAEGANEVTGLTVADVLQMTSNGKLDILGTGLDTVQFANNADWTHSTVSGYDVYTAVANAAVVVRIEDDIQQPFVV